MPLDSQIFKSNDIFTLEELRSCQLSRNSKYGPLTSKSKYDILQNTLKTKSKLLSQIDNFYPIYFDLCWGSKNSRYKSWGNNLFETNFGAPMK